MFDDSVEAVPMPRRGRNSNSSVTALVGTPPLLYMTGSLQVWTYRLEPEKGPQDNSLEALYALDDNYGADSSSRWSTAKTPVNHIPSEFS